MSRTTGPVDGPDALLAWGARWPGLFRAGYGAAVGSGGPPTTVVLAMPRTESLEDPPVGFDLQPYDEADEFCRKLTGNPLGAAPSGAFNFIISRAAGRFRGTVTGLLPVPKPGEVLPLAAYTPPPPGR